MKHVTHTLEVDFYLDGTARFRMKESQGKTTDSGIITPLDTLHIFLEKLVNDVVVQEQELTFKLSDPNAKDRNNNPALRTNRDQGIRQEQQDDPESSSGEWGYR